MPGKGSQKILLPGTKFEVIDYTDVVMYTRPSI